MHTLLAVLASLGQVTVVTVVAPASLRLETDAPEPAPEKGAKSAYMSVVQKNAAAAAAAAALAAVAAANESASAEPGGPFYNYASLPSSEGYGLGQELWSSAGGDAVAVADAPILRLTPSNLRVDPEAFDVILGVVRSGGGGGGSGGRVSPHLCAYLAQQPHHPPMVDASFTVLRMRPTGPTGPTRGTWSAASVLSVLQLLLPGAKLSAAAVEDTWTAPPYKGAQGGKGGVFKRLVQLARAKVQVLCGRQSEEGRRVFQERIKELTGGGGGGGESGGNSPLQRLIRGMRGVHGVLLLPTGARTMVEACSSYIIARPSAMGGMGMDVGELEAEVVVQGVFGSREAALLMELFDACKSHRLLPRPPLLPSDVSFETRLRVQRGRGDRELPGGWWFDGQGYIDIQGSRCPLRPDIEVLVGEYVQQENEKIGAYNELLVDL
ncbi:hypothetical protein B484DRAFT_420408 [Ochromonadaceae sp. CCMP2298]|nr:hypothetical protein B484DRAFT_420408 [Ochromonadaceae sp. CCMP2298]